MTFQWPVDQLHIIHDSISVGQEEKMKKQITITLSIIVFFVAILSLSYAQAEAIKSVVPLPPSLKNLPTLEVEP